jgi:hypothetical protein
VARQARRYERLSESRSGDDLAALLAQARSLARGTPFAAPLASIEEAMFETLLGVGIRIITGEFDAFNWETSEADLDRWAVINLLGAANAERHSISGNKLEIANSIEGVLREISKTLRWLVRRRSISEPSREVRREVAQVFEVGTGLYDMLSPLFGRSAFGLRFANWIGLSPDIGVHSAILLVWSELRAFSTVLRPQNEIAELHGEMVKAWKLATRFQSALAEASPDNEAQIFAELEKSIPIPKRVNALRKLSSNRGN